MGGVGARFADDNAFSCADAAQTRIEKEMQHAAITDLVFMSNVVPELSAPGLDNQPSNLMQNVRDRAHFSARPVSRQDLQFLFCLWLNIKELSCL
ncbi:MAG TPA: hypothetical protein VMG82_37980 [Candidatus Sulfotelmatobacter sp.]|nr:hypothetical protein [Candidatus Sulfotelmatobacter sp.]